MFLDVTVDVGCIDIIGLREATEAENHDENARPWRWALLVDLLCIFPYNICHLHAMLCDIRLSYWYIFGSSLLFRVLLLVCCLLNPLIFLQG